MVPGILAQLRAHQADVLDALADMQARLAAESLDTLGIADARREFTRQLTRYQIFKHRLIFEPLTGHGCVHQGAAVREMKIGCIVMSHTFRAYMARWNMSAIEGRAADYRREARGMVAMIERHLRSDRHEIDAMLALEKHAA